MLKSAFREDMSHFPPLKLPLSLFDFLPTAHEDMRVHFAQKANIVGPWIENKVEVIMNLFSQPQGSMEEQLEQLQLFDHDATLYKPYMEELEGLNQAVQEAMIFENPHTEYTMEVLELSTC